MHTVHPVRNRRFGSFLTQPLESLSADSVELQNYESIQGCPGNPTLGAKLVKRILVMRIGCSQSSKVFISSHRVMFAWLVSISRFMFRLSASRCMFLLLHILALTKENKNLWLIVINLCLQFYTKSISLKSCLSTLCRRGPRASFATGRRSAVTEPRALPAPGSRVNAAWPGFLIRRMESMILLIICLGIVLKD